MAVKIKNTLSHYLQKLQNYKGNISEEEIKQTAGDIGVETVKRNLGSETANVDYDLTNSGVTINAYGEDLPFIEFGTGIRGKGKYPGELPPETMKLQFHSNGADRETDGWKYNYMKEKYGATKDWIGNEPQAPVYKSARELEQGGLAEGIKNKIKEN